MKVQFSYFIKISIDARLPATKKIVCMKTHYWQAVNTGCIDENKIKTKSGHSWHGRSTRLG